MTDAERTQVTRFGWLVSHRRQELDWSRRELAERARISPSYLRRIETTGQLPSRLVIASLSRALDMDERTLLRAAGYLEDQGRDDDLTTEEMEVLSLWRNTPPDVRRALLAAMREAAFREGGQDRRAA